MKNFFIATAFVFALAGCASDSETKKEDGTDTPSSSENAVGVQNVNGNIPDTVNTIDIGTHQPNAIAGSDSLAADSLKK